MKRKSLLTHQSHSPSPLSAKQISESLVQTDTQKAFRRKIRETMISLWVPEAGQRKLATELLFLKDVKIRGWNVFSFEASIFNLHSKDFVHEQNKKSIEKIIFLFGSHFVSHISCFSQTTLFAIIKKKPWKYKEKVTDLQV